MKVQQISVFVENKSGTLKEVTGILAEAGVNLEALNIAETKEYGIVRIIADDTPKAVDALIGSGLVIKVSPVVVAAVPNVAGGLDAILGKIAAADINIEYMYSIFGGKDAESKMVFKADKPEELAKII